ncbi:hypothetical protein [Amaricoccus sp.]|uniref:hypothetical protein n=1 Tax=Amaricoccus sp. TaxID=1872485 RepID=UPI0026112481|nr:hypothetical protein [Amaricoccus sp.]HRO13387.1 hypothetical protein [Amaricoccus sp.]
MPAILLSPLALRLMQVGAVAAMAVYASRRRSEPKDLEQERVLDELPEGLAVRSHRAEAERGMHAAGRFRRVLRLGGAAFEIEAAALGRFRLRRAA